MSQDDKIKGTAMTANTTDRELLELAAKAAGVAFDPEKSKPHLVSGAFWGLWLRIKGEPYEGQRRYWNPLTDDGDALRLAVKLRIRVANMSPRACAFTGLQEFWEPEGDDACKATRRAIVRAAAEIGKAMP